MNGTAQELNLRVDAGASGAVLLARLGRVGIGTGLVFAAGLGIFGRFSGLGSFPLAVDEYYFVQSVKAILEHGVPAFETGGYYSRALLVQYLTAASIWLFGDGGFAYRVPAALFSLATIPLAYFYGQKRLGSSGGVVLAVLLLVSAWEIEFGRFARMYSALQFFTLLFFVATDKAADQKHSRWSYAPHVTLLVAMLVHEFAILLVPFLVLAAIETHVNEAHGRLRLRWGYLLVTSGVALLCYFIFANDLRNVGVVNRLPADYVPPPRPPTADSPWRLPILPFFPESVAEMVPVLIALLSAAAAGGFVLLKRLSVSVEESDLLGALLLIAAVFHQFLFAALVAVLMAARGHLLGTEPAKRRARVVLALAFGLGACWLAYAVSSQAWIPDTFRPEYGYSPNYTLPKALIRTFLGWPDVIDSVVLPWMRDLPVTGAAAIAAGAYQLASRGRAPLMTWARHPAVILVAVAMAFGVHVTDYSSIRYSFFIYPFVLALILLSGTEAATALVRRFKGDARFGRAAGLAGCLVLFTVSSDLHLRQIVGVATAPVRFRLDEFQRYESIWYERWDYESPAVFLNNRAGLSNGDKVIVVEQQPVSFYLEVPHAVYYSRTSNLYWDHSRAEGTVDLWSNQPLLSTPADLRKYARCASNVWIVEAASPVHQPVEIDQVWESQMVSATPVFRSVDNRLTVLHVRLKPEATC